MNFQQLYSAIELNKDYYAERGVCLYSTFIVATPVAMPKRTRDAVIVSWNTAYEREYGQSPERLWVKGLQLAVLEEAKELLFKSESVPLYDILLNKLLVQTVDITQKGWQQKLNEAYAEMHVNAHNAHHQLMGLAQAMLKDLAPAPTYNIPLTRLDKLDEVLACSLEADIQLERARKALWPFIYRYIGCDVAHIAEDAVNYLNILKQRELDMQKVQKSYDWYNYVSATLSS